MSVECGMMLIVCDVGGMLFDVMFCCVDGCDELFMLLYLIVVDGVYSMVRYLFGLGFVGYVFE